MSHDEKEQEAIKHRQAVERYRVQREKECALVGRIHREAIMQHQEEESSSQPVSEQFPVMISGPIRKRDPFPIIGSRTVHYTELPEPEQGDKYFAEWTTYRRELPRLLESGHEGRFVLLKGENVIGIWDTYDDAMAEAYELFPQQTSLVYQLREREPVLRSLSGKTIQPRVLM